MKINIIQLAKDLNISYWTSGKNCQKGWVNFTCPFCGDKSNHLGFNLENNYFHCWRCGAHPIEKVLRKWTNSKNVNYLIKKYSYDYTNVNNLIHIEKINNDNEIKFPIGIDKINDKHKNYLLKRNFNPQEIEEKWKILGTSHFSILDNIDFKWRIIIPIFWNNEIVSYQARSIINDYEPRYINCPSKYEKIHLKNIIYKYPTYNENKAIAVEGVFSVWRLGEAAFATFGAKFTNEQIRIISKLFKRVLICFDNDEAGRIAAKKLQSELELRNVKTEIYFAKTDVDNPLEAQKIIEKFVVL